MKFEAVTIKDIAKELGFSTSTVSRALRDSYEISAETKKLVLACAERLNYHPNPIALSLKEKRSRSIGVVVSEIANAFFSQAINGVESIAYSRGYNIIISQSHESLEREIIDLNYLASRSIDGLLLSVSSETENMEHIKKLHNRGLPIVFFDRVTEEIDTHKVMVNNCKGAYDATKHLIEQGYTNIACLTNAAHLSISKERMEGYHKALTEAGYPLQNELLKFCNHGGLQVEEVKEALQALLQASNRPDAIICMSDKLTIECLRILQQEQVDIPGNIALVGFSNSDVTELLNPSLTVIRQPAFTMGEVATNLLLELIESKRPTKAFAHEVLEPQLIVRNSSLRRS